MASKEPEKDPRKIAAIYAKALKEQEEKMPLEERIRKYEENKTRIKEAHKLDRGIKKSIIDDEV